MTVSGRRRVMVVGLAVLVLAPSSVGTLATTADAPGPDSPGVGDPVSGEWRVRPVASDSVAAVAPDAAGGPAPSLVERVSAVRATADGGRASVVGTGEVLSGVERTLTMTQRLHRTPDERGTIRARHVFAVPQGVSTIETRLPEGATVVDTDGFTATDGGYQWDGESRRATLTYTVPVNETVDVGGPEGFEGEYLFADAGEWALVRRPQVSVSWAWEGDQPVGFERNATTAGPGYVGDVVAYMGRHETYTRRAHGQRLELVVPRRASLAVPPERVLDALAGASDRLRVGDRDEVVHVVAAPTTGVRWGVRGLQVGDAAMWVRDEEPLDVPDNTWLHEYAHSRQAFETRPATRWLTEATATYYGASLALAGGYTDYDDFREFLRLGSREPQSGAVLREPGAWPNSANYWKGALVVGALDRRVRLATDRRRSFGAVLSRLNERREPVDEAAFLAAVRGTAGSDVAETAASLTRTPRVPETWSPTGHDGAFGERPAQFTARLGPPPGGAETHTPTVRVSGPYRNGTLSGRTPTLYTGETVTVTGTVSNAGGTSATYERTFTVGSTVERTVSGRLAPGETASHSLEHTVDAAGERTLAFGTDSLTLRAFDPATAAISNVTVDPLRLSEPGTITVDVTVANEYGVPARRNVTVTRDGQQVGTRSVALSPGGRRSTSVPVELPATGQYRIGVVDAGSATAVVGDDGGGVTALGPGFGPALAVVALLVGGLLTGVARRRR